VTRARAKLHRPLQRLVITTCSAEVTLADIVATGMKLRDDPEFRPYFCHLNDLSHTSKLDLHYKDLQTIRHSFAPFSNESRRAFVAPGTGASFGLARMYQFLVDSTRFEVFHSVVEAISWLGLDATVLEIRTGGLATSSREHENTVILDLPHDVPASFLVRGLSAKKRPPD
jgi:hypothetical protein